MAANWNTNTHICFPSDFRQRIFTVLLCNRRARCTGLPSLPRDPLFMIFQLVANSEYCDDEMQINDTKALVTMSYNKLTLAQ